MTAPVVGFTAETPKGFGGRESLIKIEPEPGHDTIWITLEQKLQRGREASLRYSSATTRPARSSPGWRA